MSDDPRNIMVTAAGGDREAQRLMVLACFSSQFVDVPPFEAMVGAEAFARMVACHGVADDQFLLAGVLYQRALHVQQLSDDNNARVARLCAEVSDIINDTPIVGGNDGGGLEFLAGVLAMQADDGDDYAASLESNLMRRAGPSVSNSLRNAINGAEKAAALSFAVEQGER